MPSPNITERDVQPCGCADPGAANPSLCYCGVEDLLRIIRRRYSLVVMNAIHVRGEARYAEVAAALPGTSSSTLAETLHALEATQLIVRQSQTDARPHATYRLSPSGAKLLNRLRELLTDIDSA